jgi:Methylamine utilisation protein MauE
MAYATLGCQWLLATVFAVAGLSKLVGQARFSEFVAATGRLLPPHAFRWRQPAAVLVVAGELATVGLLLVPGTSRVGFGIAAGLSTAFAVGIAAAVRRGERAPCRCFGLATRPLGAAQLIRAVLLVGVALAGYGSSLASLDRPIHPAGALIMAAAAVLAAVLIIRLDDLAVLFRPVSTRR